MKVDRQRIAMKAVIVDKGKILILREAVTGNENTNIGRYHFPGGRVEQGEPYEKALKREVYEETGLKIRIGQPLYVGEWWPTIKTQKNQIIAVFIMCELKDSANISLSEEHDSYEWIDPVKRSNYDLMPPDDLVVDAAHEVMKKNV